MARLDSSEFQQLMYEGVRARARSTDVKALTLLVLDGLLMGGLIFGARLGGERIVTLAPGLIFSRGGLGLIALAVLSLAGLCAALALWRRSSSLVLGQPDVSSYDEYLQAVRRLTGDAVREELARRTWEQHSAQRGKQRWVNVALLLTLAGLLLFGLINLPAFL
jgi:hypothetical protein